VGLLPGAVGGDRGPAGAGVLSQQLLLAGLARDTGNGAKPFAIMKTPPEEPI
jgi:hypothetical protein